MNLLGDGTAEWVKYEMYIFVPIVYGDIDVDMPPGKIELIEEDTWWI